MTDPGEDVVTVELDEAHLDLIDEVVAQRLAIPVSRVEFVAEWTTASGHRIRAYEHIREYPPHLIVWPVIPGQTTEMRGWPCPACLSTDTSGWGVTTVPESADFKCHECGASGTWNVYCGRETPIRLDGERCECPWPDWMEEDGIVGCDRW